MVCDGLIAQYFQVAIHFVKLTNRDSERYCSIGLYDSAKPPGQTKMTSAFGNVKIS